MNPDEEALAADLPYAYWLDRLRLEIGLGQTAKRRLIEKLHTARSVYDADIDTLMSCGLGRVQADAICHAHQDVTADYEEMLSLGVRYYPFYHPDYPRKLYDTPGAPLGLYVRGKLPRKDLCSLAIVGARECTEYGRYVAAQMAGDLACKGIQIISGMARGIDSIAQAAAIKAGGASYAVLGGGADNCYPAQNKELYEQLCDSYGVISEYPPGTVPLGSNFPARNRIISGLSDAVLVVEARRKSGSLITVDFALEQGRDVYAVPGRVTDRLSDGCNLLLMQGAKPALSPDQVYDELTHKTGEQLALTLDSTGLSLSADEAVIYGMLGLDPMPVDYIYEQVLSDRKLAGLTLPRVLEILVGLSVKGVVVSTGGYYSIKAN